MYYKSGQGGRIDALKKTGQGGLRRIHSCDFIELPPPQNIEKRVSRYRKNDACIRHAYQLILLSHYGHKHVLQMGSNDIWGREKWRLHARESVELPEKNVKNASRGNVKT